MLKRITFRLTAAISSILLLVVCVMVFLNYTKFQKVFTVFYQSRIDYVIKDMKQAVEFSLGMGLALSDLKNTQDLIERVRKEDKQIIAIQVVDPSGSVVFTTHKDAAGDKTVPDAWLTKTRSTSDIWTIHDADAMVIGVPLLNAIDQVSGSLVLEYSRSFYDGLLKEMLWDMAKMGALIFVAGTGVSLMLAFLMFDKTMQGFVRVSQMLNRIESGYRITPGEIASLSPLEQRFVSICFPVQSALDQINGVMDALGSSHGKETK
jgi:hypothetical protein